LEEILENKASVEKSVPKAQRGKDRNGYETIVEPHGQGNRKSEGDNLLDLCSRNDCVIGNNWFKKRRRQQNEEMGELSGHV
jgi:hypothetical protein